VLTEEAVCLLDVPVHKTGTALSKPVDPLVGQAIEAWQALRPAQPTQPNRVRPLRQRPRSASRCPDTHQPDEEERAGRSTVQRVRLQPELDLGGFKGPQASS